jgi:folylpolyglutamate synthase/dihydropteroate synthase
MDVIGDTLEEIAWEKAGVIKNNIPCVIGPTASQM